MTGNCWLREGYARKGVPIPGQMGTDSRVQGYRSPEQRATDSRLKGDQNPLKTPPKRGDLPQARGTLQVGAREIAATTPRDAIASRGWGVPIPGEVFGSRRSPSRVSGFPGGGYRFPGGGYRPRPRGVPISGEAAGSRSASSARAGPPRGVPIPGRWGDTNSRRKRRMASRKRAGRWTPRGVPIPGGAGYRFPDPRGVPIPGAQIRMNGRTSARRFSPRGYRFPGSAAARVAGCDGTPPEPARSVPTSIGGEERASGPESTRCPRARHRPRARARPRGCWPAGAGDGA